MARRCASGPSFGRDLGLNLQPGCSRFLRHRSSGHGGNGRLHHSRGRRSHNGSGRGFDGDWRRRRSRVRLCRRSCMLDRRRHFAHGRFHHHGDRRRHNCDCRTHSHSSSGSLCDHWTSGRARCNGRRMRGGYDGRCRPGGRHNLSRLRANWSGSRRRGGNHRGLCWRSCNRGRRPRRRMALACLRLNFLLLGHNGLHHIAGLGNVREIDLGRNCLGGARSRTTAVARCPRSTLKLRTNLVGLVVFNRTGVGLALSETELCQHVKNLTAFHFHLAREIVDSNLTHPPLFKTRDPKPLVAHSYLMALAAS